MQLVYVWEELFWRAEGISLSLIFSQPQKRASGVTYPRVKSFQSWILTNLRFTCRFRQCTWNKSSLCAGQYPG